MAPSLPSCWVSGSENREGAPTSGSGRRQETPSLVSKPKTDDDGHGMRASDPFARLDWRTRQDRRAKQIQHASSALGMHDRRAGSGTGPGSRAPPSLLASLLPSACSATPTPSLRPDGHLA